MPKYCKTLNVCFGSILLKNSKFCNDRIFGETKSFLKCASNIDHETIREFDRHCLARKKLAAMTLEATDRVGKGAASPHFSPGLRERAQDGDRLSHRMGVIISPPGKAGGLVFVSAALERKA